MNDIIFNVLPSQGPTIPPWIPYLGGLPYNSPLIGSFLGVFAAFGINYVAHKINDHKTRNYYRSVIIDEIERCIKTLEKQKDEKK